MKDARGAATATADELIQPVLATKHVVGALQHLQKQLDKDQTPLFVREKLAQELLQKLIVTSFSEEDALCECLLRGCGQFVAVSAAVRTLKEIQKADDNSFGAFDLSLVVLRRSLCTRVKDAAQVKQPVGVSADDWVNLLLRLPSIIANACHTLDTSFPSWATQGKYYPRLVDCALGMIMLTDDATAYCRSLVQQMLRRGGEEVTLGMYHAYERASARNHSREKVSCAIRTILRSLVPREFAVVSRFMILYALSAEDKVDENVRFSNEWLDSILRTVLASDRGHCDAFVRSMVLSSQTKDWKLCYITASLLAGAPPPENGDDIAAATASSDDDSDSEDSQTGYEKHPPEDRLLRRYLSEISVQWSEARFVRQTDAKQQRNVSIFLRVGMNLLIGPMEDAASSLVAVLLEGVTERLSSSTRSIRIDGMRVAELLAKRLGEEVHFDELEEEEEHAKETDKVFAKTGSLINKNKKGHTKKHFILKETDPDALYVSDEEDSDGNEKSDSYNDDSTWDEESVLEPYDLHDDEEDIRETPRPLYLADCLDLLRIPESNEHAASSHETALNEVTQLVRSRPMDLPDLGALLAFELLRLEDKFNTSGFSELVSESLCALAVEEPFSVGEMLIKELFQDMGLADRLTALDTLANAAIELSGSHELLELRKGSQGERKEHHDLVTTTQSTSTPGLEETRTLRKDTALLVNGTRRWSTRDKHQPPRKSQPNSFSQIAPVWFYSLLGSFLERRDNKRVWGGTSGAKFLANLFQTLAIIVECSRNTPGTDALAKDLVQLVWGFRNAEISEVRASVLFAVATSFGLLRTDAALSMILEDTSTDSLGYNLPIMAREDPDENCRNIAGLLVRNVASAMNSSSPGSSIM